MPTDISIQVRDERVRLLLQNAVQKIPGWPLEIVDLSTQAIENKYRTNVAVKTGRTRNSVYRTFTAGAGTAQGVVGTNSGYGAFPDFGFRPHIIRARRGNFLRIPLPGGIVIYRREVFHPGFAGHKTSEKSIEEASGDIKIGVRILLESLKPSSSVGAPIR